MKVCLVKSKVSDDGFSFLSTWSSLGMDTKDLVEMCLRMIWRPGRRGGGTDRVAPSFASSFFSLPAGDDRV